MHRILVTGGTGFLGRHVVSGLQDRGHEVRVFSRSASDEGSVRQRDVDRVSGDVRDQDAVDQAARGVDRIVHLASDFRDLDSDMDRAYEVNVEGTLNVLRAARQHGVQRVVHCSTIGVHGSIESPPADEDTPLDPGDVPYEKTKAQAEEALWQFVESESLEATVARPAGIYGPGDLRLLKLFRMIDRGRFVMIGPGEAFIDMVYVADVAEGLILCALDEDAAGETFILSSGEYLPVRDFVKSIADELDVAHPRLRVPITPVRAVAWMLETVCAPLGISPPLTRRRLGFFEMNRAYSSDKARRIIGYDPATSLGEGLRRTIDWYRSEELL